MALKLTGIQVLLLAGVAHFIVISKAIKKTLLSYICLYVCFGVSGTIPQLPIYGVTYVGVSV